MKILWDNYVENATITVTSEDTLFPKENLVSRFLEKRYQALGESTTITVEFQEDKTISMIAYGFNNVIGSKGVIRLTRGASSVIRLTQGAADVIRLTSAAEYRLKNSSGTVLQTGQLETGGDININYFDPIVCRSVEIDITADGTVYMGGLSIGDPLTFDYIRNDPELSQLSRGDSFKTEGGQVIGASVKSLRSWSITMPLMDNGLRKDINAMIKDVGSYKPFFADLYEDFYDEYGEKIEEPMFCNLLSSGIYPRISHKTKFSVALVFEEAR